MRGLHHVCLKANGKKEFDKAVEFYSSVFGLPLLRTWGEENTSGAMLQMDGIILEIVAGGEDSTPTAIGGTLPCTAPAPKKWMPRQHGWLPWVTPPPRGPSAKIWGAAIPFMWPSVRALWARKLNFSTPKKPGSKPALS